MASRVGDRVTTHWGDGTIVRAKGTQVCIDLDNGNLWAGDINTCTPPTVGVSPERFEYPLYRKSRISGTVVEFTGLTTGTVLASGTRDCNVGDTITNIFSHLDDWWEPCEKPKWEPTKPTWRWVWGAGDLTKRQRLIVHGNRVAYFDAENNRWPNAEPCKESELPSWWPKEWT